MVDRKAIKYQLANLIISQLANGIQLKGKCVKDNVMISQWNTIESIIIIMREANVYLPQIA
jgi:hypothetical protein